MRLGAGRLRQSTRFCAARRRGAGSAANSDGGRKSLIAVATAGLGALAENRIYDEYTGERVDPAYALSLFATKENLEHVPIPMERNVL